MEYEKHGDADFTTMVLRAARLSARPAGPSPFRVNSRSNVHQVMGLCPWSKKGGAKIGKRDGGMAIALLQNKILYSHSLI